MESESRELMTAQQALTAWLTDIDARHWIEQNAAPYRELMAYYHCAMLEVETRFRVLSEGMALHSAGNPIESIKTRLKRPESIVEKLIQNSLPLTVESIEENLSDVAGVRVICSFQSEVYLLADALLRQDGVTLVRRRDYIREPKPNGYRSLHLVISVPIFLQEKTKHMKVEVQLRTLAMDCWASLEHKLRYKKQRTLSARANEELLACAEITAALDQRFEEIHEQVQSDDAECG